MTVPHARRYLVPYLRLFPIWKYGPITDFDGRYVRDGWYPDIYGEREVTREEAERIHAASVSTSVST